jgi:glutamate-1-semialdehyde 2,1-aminomutase
MIDRDRLARQEAAEEERFRSLHPRSYALAVEARSALLGGLPMNWMARWPGDYPIFLDRARGAHVWDVDGHEYVDFCLGDTGAMTGHVPPALAEVLAEPRAATAMLPTEDAIAVGKELQRRFGLPYWQFCLTATDANRFALRLARRATGRPKVLVFAWCYHGTVDETFAVLADGRVVPRPGNLGPPVDPAVTTKVVEWNDIPALEAALAPGDVAAVLTEPVMTNMGIIHPAPGFHDALRELTRATGTVLILDETHTLSAGPGGYSARHGLEPDMLTVGKPVAGGLPAAAYGVSADLAARLADELAGPAADTAGIGGTLAANALSLAAMRRVLTEVLTEAAYDRMLRLGERFAAGVEAVIRAYDLPWHVSRLGGRIEVLFQPQPPRNGSEAQRAWDADLDRFFHLYALNRGLLLTPFHNMALMSPDTTEEDVDRHTAVFRSAVAALVG